VWVWHIASVRGKVKAPVETDKDCEVQEAIREFNEARAAEKVAEA